MAFAIIGIFRDNKKKLYSLAHQNFFALHRTRMTSTNARFLFLLPIFSLTAHTSLPHTTILERIAARIGRLHIVHLFENHVQSRINQPFNAFKGLDDRLADSHYQQLGKEGQEKVGIPQYRQVPIKKIFSHSPFIKIAGAIAEPDAIYVNEIKLKERPYGAQRCALFHEAVHKKYHDVSLWNLLENSSLIGCYLAGRYICKKFQWQQTDPMRRRIFLALTSLVLTAVVTKKYQLFMERRADIEGHYATACYQCVEESLANRKMSFTIDNNPLRYNGYLWPEELQIIADDLRTQQKLCKFHQASSQELQK